MAIKWFNIRSGETQVAESEPHISAMWASSDHSPNITQGQDFGWRLAPEVVIEMKEIKQDIQILQLIATRIGKPLEDVGEPDILTYISAKIDAANAPVANVDDYNDFYDQEVRRLTKEQLEAKKKATNEAATIGSTNTQESLEDLERRVALEERLAAARAINAAPETTTTTTEAEPITTTTTTKAVRTTTTTTEAK